MTDFEKLEMLKCMTGEQDENVLLTYLALAGSVVRSRAFPFEPNRKDVPDCYALVQIDIAVYLLNKRGAEGETLHNENGINRSYESGGVPESLLRRITPFAAPFGV